MLSKLNFHQKQSNLLRRPISHAQTMKPMVKWIEMIIKDRIRMKNKESEKMCSNNKKNIRSEESKRVQCIEILMLHVFDDNKQESVDFLRYRCNARMQFKRKYITLLLNLYKSLQHIRSFFAYFLLFLVVSADFFLFLPSYRHSVSKTVKRVLPTHLHRNINYKCYLILCTSDYNFSSKFLLHI